MLTMVMRFCLCAVACLGAGLFGFIGVVAFADAQTRCPGSQCSDAQGMAVLGGGLFLFCLIVACLAGRHLK